MALSLFEKFGMRLRKTPVKLIEQNLIRAHENGIEISASQLEAHYLSRGNVTNLVDALILGKKNGQEISYLQVSAIELSGHNSVEVVRSTFDEKEFIFDQFSSNFDDKIQGFCKDGSEVFAECVVRYHLTVDDCFGSRTELLQEQLSARIAVYINTAVSFKELLYKEAEINSKLLLIAVDLMAGVKEINVNFKMS